MLLEAIHHPLRFRFADGMEVRLAPGQPVPLDEDRACRLLKKARGKVRAVPAFGEIPEVVIEPACLCRPVYWESMNGQAHGPAMVWFTAKMGRLGSETFWLCVEEGGRTVWIQDRLLVSRQTAETKRRHSAQEPHGR